MEFKDYYQTLGVPRDATAEDIKRAFRRLARKYHPDVSKAPDAERRMQEINEANAVLSDPEKRAAYDRLGPHDRPGQEFRAPPGWETGFDFSARDFSPEDLNGFSDVFAEFFGRPVGAGQTGPGHAGFRASGPFETRGGDHRATVLLDVEDSFTAPVRQLSVQVPGFDASGRLSPTTRTLNVKIPRGVRAGQVIRLAGQGSAGTARGVAGDLLLDVAFRPHLRFRVVGADLHLDLPVAPWEAALGAVVEVAVPEGQVKVRIPPGAQSGRQLRVRGKGIPSQPPGDLLLDVQVVLPPADTPKARQLYETMARELAFNPRPHGKG